MELQILSFPILLCLLSVTFMVLKLGKLSKINESTSNLPPGPWKLPLIGNLHQLVSSPPHRALRELARKHGPLMYLRLGEIPLLIVSSAEYAREVMKTRDILFASRPRSLASENTSTELTGIIHAPYGEYWRQVRKICILELLSTKRVQSFRSIREEEMSNFIRWIFSKAGSPVNLTEKFYSSTYTLVSKVAFSKECKDQEDFISLIKEATKLSAGFSIEEVFPSMKVLRRISGVRSKIKKLHEQLLRIVGNIINEHFMEKEISKTRKYDKDEDLVDILLKFHEQGDRQFQLTIDNIKSIILDIFGAGSETSATTLDWAMVEMIRNPRVLLKAQAEVRQVFDSRGKADESGIPELKYLKSVIKETLRLHPPAPLLIPRENSERCEINGYGIPAKTRVLVNAWAIGRDPKHWNEAEVFYPERFIDNPIDYKGTDFEYIPFGAGRRICPGMMFGLMNVEFPLSQLLYYFDWKLPSGVNHEDLNMTEAFGTTVRRRDDLSLIPTPYHPSTIP
ncbi:cytochrome P450 71D9-like [Tripterygium wilfordii]|uniref:cytochrome P450 71D9-like n=1 Tax=Tripterygium wilfordii TaxID=458696 RepID=UPI0018F817A3|nr:cytochrome P450 71D9-like [Tripterygium wilfordii]